MSENSQDDQVDVDVTVATKDGRVTISFCVPIEDLTTLESFIHVDMLNKIADAVSEKASPLQNATPEQ